MEEERRRSRGPDQSVTNHTWSNRCHAGTYTVVASNGAGNQTSAAEGNHSPNAQRRQLRSLCIGRRPDQLVSAR